jgi:pimeloyl-ACP methyl ester carboxylesterase
MRAFAFGLVALALTACGNDDASDTSGIGKEERVLLVVMGGNTSCARDADGRNSPRGMSMYEPFTQLVSDLEGQGRVVDYLLTCHTSSATVQAFGSDDPDTLLQLDRAAFQAKLAQLKVREADSKVYMAGHSYGGWLAMKTALELDIRYDGMFTIDPISRETCTFTRPFGCTSAPGDINTSMRELIRQRSGTWANYYQTRTGYLRSSAIAQAHENAELEYSHVDIDTAPEVWSRLTESVLTDLM